MNDQRNKNIFYMPDGRGQREYHPQCWQSVQRGDLYSLPMEVWIHILGGQYLQKKIFLKIKWEIL